MQKHEYKIFSGTSSFELAKDMSKYLKKPLGKIDVGRFPNGEVRVEVHETVRGVDVFIVQSTCPPVDENLMELLLIVDAMRRSSAASITAIIPYFGYSKQDKKKSGREPISARLVADLLQGCGVTRVVTLDIHAEQIEGFFSIPMDNLTGLGLMEKHIKKEKIKDLVVVAPDAGGTKRARDLANRLGARRLAIIDKYRPTWRKATAMNVIGKVKGMNAVIVDDFIDTGGSIVEAIKAVKNHKAKSIRVACIHPVLTPPAIQRLKKAPMEELIVTNTIPIPAKKMFKKIKVLSVAEVLAETIKRIVGKGSLSHYRTNFR